MTVGRSDFLIRVCGSNRNYRDFAILYVLRNVVTRLLLTYII